MESVQAGVDKSTFVTGLHQSQDFPYHTQHFICHLHIGMCVVLYRFIVQVLNLAIGNIQQYIYFINLCNGIPLVWCFSITIVYWKV
jgi:hypothetical protein